MRSYVIDEIRPMDIKKISDYLRENSASSNLDQVFWVEIPKDILSETQFEHSNCQPHAFAVELGHDWVKLEFLVRSLKNMQCTCPGYGTKQQRNFIINFAHSMVAQLGINT